MLTPEELDSAKQETEAFLQSDGARLDAVLQQWAPEEGNRSYVERYRRRFCFKWRFVAFWDDPCRYVVVSVVSFAEDIGIRCTCEGVIRWL